MLHSLFFFCCPPHLVIFTARFSFLFLPRRLFRLNVYVPLCLSAAPRPSFCSLSFSDDSVVNFDLEGHLGML